MKPSRPFLIALAILVIRVLVMPQMLLWSIRHATVRREEGPLIGVGPSLVIAGFLVGISFLLGNRLRLRNGLWLRCRHSPAITPRRSRPWRIH